MTKGQNTAAPCDCFICLSEVEGQPTQLPSRTCREAYPAAMVCPECRKDMKTSIACISVTTASFNRQAQASMVWGDRKNKGQNTPFPLVVNRTGATLFLPDTEVGKFYGQQVARNTHPALALAVYERIRKDRFMFVPDEFIGERSNRLTKEDRVFWANMKIDKEEEEREMDDLLARAQEELL